MEAAEVPESTTKLLIGHKRASLTFGHYSKGERVKLRKAIEKLKYPPEVMRLIRAGDKLKRPHGPQRRHRPRVAAPWSAVTSRPGFMGTHTRPERVEINRRPVVRGLNLLG
jgi:hypothetical protein